mmetsp:Transcript_13478/g.21215  ORF Transcript_13478/g.21215 Transcript_13478/m.21215 type:complete len:95 (+) Transcript_13478:100-384(+)|eukprot:CAMPEP_0197038438 /NCGR_PEP_ID=MMETSP1384-20130603/15380_1 /TAXON_ID=29189 /ORGANISM="Ammonia sp." /LENGTH=94 /DNA_ID=CAMNT_0042468871 /DNA_START=124 /DNA_END=408 /DNA_ORIENTATION=+
MGDDEEIKSLPFVSDKATINFAVLQIALCGGHILDRHILTRRMHIRAFRYAAWVVPLSVAGVYIAQPALPMKFKQFFWSFGMKGRFWPPYEDEE